MKKKIIKVVTPQGILSWVYMYERQTVPEMPACAIWKLADQYCKIVFEAMINCTDAELN